MPPYLLFHFPCFEKESAPPYQGRDAKHNLSSNQLTVLFFRVTEDKYSLMHCGRYLEGLGSYFLFSILVTFSKVETSACMVW